MRGIFLLVFVVWSISFVFAQDSERTDSLNFQCTVLYPEKAKYPDVSAVSDTVRFKVFYVDDGCSGFTYSFLKKENLLLVQRITSLPDTCTTDEQVLYGVEGFISNVPVGKYLFELQIGTPENEPESIFRDKVIVKK